MYPPIFGHETKTFGHIKYIFLIFSCPKGSSTCDEVTGGGGGAAGAILSKSREVPGKCRGSPGRAGDAWGSAGEAQGKPGEMQDQ